MPAKLNDVRFAHEMLAMTKADVERATAHPDSHVQRSIAIWMTHELERIVPTLDIPRGEWSAIMEESQHLRRTVLNINVKPGAKKHSGVRTMRQAV